MKKVLAFGILFTPFVAFAQSGSGIAGGVSNFSALLSFLQDLLSTATVLILAAAVVYFLWNVFGFVMSASDPEKRAEKQIGIIYGVIGIAVMVSLWGLVNFLTSSAKLNTTGGAVNQAPTLNFGR